MHPNITPHFQLKQGVLNSFLPPNKNEKSIPLFSLCRHGEISNIEIRHYTYGCRLGACGSQLFTTL